MKTISHYKIVSELGRGGMGIVYRAEDTKLDRTVALKVLPPHALTSEEDRARFYREARAAAALNHAHIATVYEIDEAIPEGTPEGAEARPFIAMEFIEGETLADHIAQGPLTLDDVVRIGTQIAQALEAAHEKEIIHRDVKSANVMVTTKGAVKVLDFGLAKTAHSTKLTQMGSTLGTVAYMSPEQARGEEVDRRTDLWSLGIVLYEMMVGHLPFPGDYEQAVLYSILNQEPEPLTALRSGVPMGLEWIVSKLLSKDPDARYQSATELMVDLGNVDRATASLSRSVAAVSAAPSSFAQATVKEPRRVWQVTIPLLVGLLAFAAAWLLRGAMTADDPEPLRKLTLHLDGMTQIQHPIMSPDERYIAFAGVDTTGYDGIYLHDLATGETARIEGSRNHTYLNFSPDGQRLLMLGGADAGRGRLSTVVIPNGLPAQIVERGGAAVWENDTAFLYGNGGDVYRYPLPDGPPQRVAVPDSLPGAEQFIYTGDILREENTLIASKQYASGDNADLITVDLQTGRWKILETGAINGWYVADGFLIYQLGTDTGKIVIRPFDRKALHFTGPPEDLFPAMDWFRVRATPSGDLLYVPDAVAPGMIKLEWLAEDGSRSTAVTLTNEFWFDPALSPDGQTVLVSFSETAALWDVPLFAIDVTSGDRRAATTSTSARDAAWAPDGRAYYYVSGGFEEPYIVRQELGDLSTVEHIGSNARSPSLSRDGQWLVYNRSPAVGGDDIMALNLATGDSLEIAATPDTEIMPAISPNGAWVAYSVRGSEEVALRIFSMSDARTRTVATGLDDRAVWAPDGSSLYYTRRGRLYRLPFDGSGESRAFGVEEHLPFDGFVQAIMPDRNSGRLLLLTTDRTAEKDYVTLEWWQNWSAHLSQTLSSK